MLHFAGILTVSVQSQAICKGKISHFPHCDMVTLLLGHLVDVLVEQPVVQQPVAVVEPDVVAEHAHL